MSVIPGFDPGTHVSEATYRIVGRHPQLGVGTFGYYYSCQSANENAQALDLSGGEVDVLPVTPVEYRTQRQALDIWLMVSDNRHDDSMSYITNNERDAWLLLKQTQCAILFVDYDLGLNQGNGLSLIETAWRYGRLPGRVSVIAEKEPQRSLLITTLLAKGYQFSQRNMRDGPRGACLLERKEGDVEPRRRRKITINLTRK